MQIFPYELVETITELTGNNEYCIKNLKITLIWWPEVQIQVNANVTMSARCVKKQLLGDTSATLSF